VTTASTASVLESRVALAPANLKNQGLRAPRPSGTPAEEGAVSAPSGATTDSESWEDKPKYELSEDERQAIGATPIGYYVSRQAPRWSVVDRALRNAGRLDLAERAASMKRELRAAARPYAKYDASALIAAQRELIAEIEPLKLDFRLGDFGLAEITEINEAFVDDHETVLIDKAEQEL
jgi:hypothetical protein